MQVLLHFYRSSIGKKVVMALTGLVLVGFVISHMAGNLKVFGGINPETGLYKVDEYGAFLREMGAGLFGHSGVLWTVRIVLLLAVVLHVVTVIQLRRMNAQARPAAYKMFSPRMSTIASRTMYVGGFFLLFFIVFHILHFTTGHLHFSGFEHGRVYANVFSAFQNPLLVTFYVLAMAALGLHLYHGVWSMFQTVGVDVPRWNPALRGLAKGVSVIVAVGFSVVPVAVMLGFVNPPAGGAQHTSFPSHVAMEIQEG